MSNGKYLDAVLVGGFEQWPNSLSAELLVQEWNILAVSGARVHRC